MIRIRYRTKTIELKLGKKPEQCNGIDITGIAKRHKHSPNIKPEYTKKSKYFENTIASEKQTKKQVTKQFKTPCKQSHLKFQLAKIYNL